MHDRDAGFDRQRGHGQMRQGTPADRAVGELVGLAPDGSEQALDAIGGHAWINDQHARLGREYRDGGDVLVGLVGHLGEQQRIDDERPDDADTQRVAIRCRLGRCRRPGVAAGARPVLHHEGRAEALLQSLGDDPGQAVRRRAGDERHDDGDSARRPFLRAERTTREREGEHAQQETLHCPLLIPILCAMAHPFTRKPSAIATGLSVEGRSLDIPHLNKPPCCR
jgi:hypothetical protein